MISEAFKSALRFVLRWEGGFVDDPDDPGGRTNKGVTQAVYNDWRAAQGLAAQDVKNITDADVESIYDANYWQRARSNELQSPLSLVHFDTAVNMGVKRAVRFLQQSVGCGVDGDFGQGTLKAVGSCDQGTAVIEYCKAREAFYRKLAEEKPTLAKFLKGWLNRLNSLRKEAGLPGFESSTRGALDFGDASYIRKIPDLGEDPEYDNL